VPDAPGLELIRGEIEQDHPGAILDTRFDRDQPALAVEGAQILAVLAWLRDAPGQGYRFLSSLHAADYLPAEPRFAVHYELLNRDRVERIRVKALLDDPGPDSLPEIDSCVELFPTAEFQEREAYDFFGIVFRGHPDLTRILLPEDYVGWPQRRDFPVGGEPVTFTYNERLYG
jgi:NADH-quinone oxidoreductase subunit C